MRRSQKGVDLSVQCLQHDALVLRVGIGVQQAYGHRLHLEPAEALDQSPEILLCQRCQHLTVRSDPLAHA